MKRRVPSFGGILATTVLLSLTARASDSGTGGECGSDPNPVYSLEALLSSCTGVARNTARTTASPMGSMALASVEERAWGFYERGLLHEFNHELDLAIADYTSAIGLRRTYGDAYAARADAYEELGDHAKAAQDYAQAAAMNYDNADQLNSRCWARAVRGHPLDLALADCNLAIKLKPDSTDAFDSRCFVNYRMANYAAAIADCSEVLERYSKQATSLYVRGLAKLKLGDAQGSEADLAAAKDADRRIAEQYEVFGVKP